MRVDRNGPIIGYGFLPRSTSVRSINRARIISLVRRNPGLMRVDLSRISGLSKATVSALVDELVSQGFLFEDSQGGTRQRRVGLYLNRDAGVAVGFEVSPGEVRGVVADMSMRILGRCSHPLPNNTVQTAVDALATMYVELLADIALPCLGVVVSLPGPTDRADQILMFSPNLGWTEVPMGQILTERLGRRVSVINVPRAMTLGEYWYGAGIGAQDMVHINIGSGIGAGVLSAGQFLSGAQGYSSEIGHTTILPDGPLCQCGNRGCLERLASMPAIVEEARRRAEQAGIAGHDWQCGDPNDSSCYARLIQAARDGDPIVLDAVRLAGYYLGIAVANLIDLFNPSLVLVGGMLAEAGELVINTIRETAQRRSFPLSFRGVEIRRAQLGADAACIGACALVIDHYVAEFEPAMQASMHGGSFASPLSLTESTMESQGRV